MAKKSCWGIFEKITNLFLILLSSVFILWIRDFASATETKKIVFYLVCGGYAAVLVLLAIEGMIVGSFSLRQLWEKLRPNTWSQRLMLLFILFTFLSTLFSAYPRIAWLGGSRGEGAVTFLIYFLCFYGVAKFARPGRWMIYLFGGAVAAFSALSILQLLGLNPLGLYPEGLNYFDADKAYPGAYLGTIGNVDYVAAFLCIVIPILAIYLLRSRDRYRWFLLIPLGMSLFVLLRMWVLAGLVGIAVGLAISFPFFLPMGKKGKILYASCFGLAAVGGIIFLYFYDAGSGLLHELHQILHGTFEDSFGTWRFYIWKNVWKLIPEHFLLGAGPDTMSLAGIPSFEQFNEGLNMSLVAYIDSAHNEYLNILFHQGVFALAAYLGGLIALLVRWIKNGGKNVGAAIFGGAVACYCVQAFFGISQFITTPFFWVALGLLEYFCKTIEKQGGRK